MWFETIVISVENESHVEVLTQHFAGRLAVLDASAAAQVKVFMDSGSSITAMSEKLVQAGGDDANRVNAGVCWACVCGDIVGPEVR